jgi:hypothetical protein
VANKFTFTCHVRTPQKVVEPASPGSRARGCPRSPHIPVIEPPSELQFRRGASDEPVEGLAERFETRRVVLQFGGANLGDVLDVACARFSRWAGGPTAAQLSKALRERWAASSPLGRCGRRGAATCRLAGAPVEATLVTLTAPLQGPTPDGVRASTVVVLLSPERDRGQPARIGHVARLAARRRARRSAQAGGRDRARRRARADPLKVLRSARRPRRALRRRAPGRAAGAPRRAARRAPTRSKRPCRAGTSNTVG